MDCSFWQQRWQRVRARSHRPFVHFVHLPKAAGSSVENWLWQSFHGNSTPRQMQQLVANYGRSSNSEASNCTPAKPTDCETYRGSHMPLAERSERASDTANAPIFVTMLRSPVDRLRSELDNMLYLLSYPATCRPSATGIPMHTICGERGLGLCAPGTGSHPSEPRPRGRWSPICKPALTLLQYVERRKRDAATFGLESNTQYTMLRPAGYTGWDVSVVKRTLERDFDVVGVVARHSHEAEHSVAEFLSRLQFVIRPPYNVSPHALSRSNSAVDQSAKLVTSLNGLPRPRVPMPTESDVHRIEQLESLDHQLYEAATRLSHKQARCLEKLEAGRTFHTGAIALHRV